MEERRTWARGNSSRRRSRYGADDDLTSLDVDGGWDSLVADGENGVQMFSKEFLSRGRDSSHHPLRGYPNHHPRRDYSNHRQPRIDYVSC